MELRIRRKGVALLSDAEPGRPVALEAAAITAIPPPPAFAETQGRRHGVPLKLLDMIEAAVEGATIICTLAKAGSTFCSDVAFAHHVL